MVSHSVNSVRDVLNGQYSCVILYKSPWTTGATKYQVIIISYASHLISDKPST